MEIHKSEQGGHQDAMVYASILNGGERLEHTLAEGRSGYVHLVRGHVSVNGVALSGGDAVIKLSGEAAIELSGAEAAELLVFDLPS